MQQQKQLPKPDRDKVTKGTEAARTGWQARSRRAAPREGDNFQRVQRTLTEWIYIPPPPKGPLLYMLLSTKAPPRVQNIRKMKIWPHRTTENTLFQLLKAQTSIYILQSSEPLKRILKRVLPAGKSCEQFFEQWRVVVRRYKNKGNPPPPTRAGAAAAATTREHREPAAQSHCNVINKIILRRSSTAPRWILDRSAELWGRSLLREYKQQPENPLRILDTCGELVL